VSVDPSFQCEARVPRLADGIKRTTGGKAQSLRKGEAGSEAD